MAQIMNPDHRRSCIAKIAPTAGQLLAELPREPLRVLMRALGTSEHQCVVAGQSKVETGAFASLAAGGLALSAGLVASRP
jgi:hypothetical protein